MTEVPPLAREAMEHARRGDLERAIAAARQAVELHPADFGLRLFLAMLHSRRGDPQGALPHLRVALQLNPQDPIAQAELVRVLIATGDLDEAARALERLRLPGNEPVRLKAILLQRRGDMTAAAPLLRDLVAIDARDFESWGNLGLCLLASGKPQEAAQALDRSLELRPDRLAVRMKWVEAHFAAGTGERALSQLRDLAARNPSDGRLCVALAHAEELLSHHDAAMAALEEAVRREPANSEALAALAEKLEQRNDLLRYEEMVGRISKLGRPSEKLPLLQARLLYRRGDIAQALTIARAAPASMDQGTRAQLIGQSLDRLGDTVGAFAAFVEMNEEDSRAGANVAAEAEATRATLAEQRALLTSEWVRSWRQDSRPTAESDPAFLVGFPRSGTTLLDTLLMGHPGLAVAEEEPMLNIVASRLGHLSRLAGLRKDEVAELRRAYLEEAERHVSDAGTRLLIDKNPLVMGSMPIVSRLFPSAKIIFMERHPCDVVLSCFMTRFQPTGFGTNFLTLEGTARLYDEMMQLWTRSAELLSLNVHVVRYERLVEDLGAELAPIADFLGVPWKSQILDHRKTASERRFIKTPSYAQVTEPVTARAVGRWARYRSQLQPVLPILAPWVRKLNYEI